MKLSLGQAAKQVGVSKPTLSRAIKSGKLSATKLDDMSYAIDPAELDRWRDANGHRNSNLLRIATQAQESETPSDDGVLRVKLESKDKEIALLTSERDDLRRRLDQEAEERRRLTLILTEQRPASPLTPAPEKAGRWAALKTFITGG